MSTEPTTITLTAGQQLAADGILNFLLDGTRELIISGPAGVGKTFLMSHVIDTVLPLYHSTCKLLGIDSEFDSVEMTATTNKAAEVLAQATRRETSTIQSFLNLTVKDDFKTGTSVLKRTRSWAPKSRAIIFIDECSMIDTALRNEILAATDKCKIIYVGDRCQLAPVGEIISPVYRNYIPMYELTEPVRNADQPALMELCQQLRNTVDGGEFLPIRVTPGVVDWLSEEEMHAAVQEHFQEADNNNRILAFRNEQVITLNDYVRRTVRDLPDVLTPGEFLVSAEMTQITSSMSLHVEQGVEVKEVSDKLGSFSVGDGLVLPVRKLTVATSLGDIMHNVMIPVSRGDYQDLLKYYSRKKEWSSYFQLKRSVADLRPRDAATVHKSQGSTYDTVFVDLSDISRCYQPEQAARLLYVAFSRARKRVVMYGELANKYGGVTA